MAKIVPMLQYADAPAAIEFLCEAFGFTVHYRMDGEDGSVGHAELSIDGSSINLASVWRQAGFADACRWSTAWHNVYFDQRRLFYG